MSYSPPVWHNPETPGGKTIIAIDGQSCWETVRDYGIRVATFWEIQKNKEKYDDRLLARIFVGGLREPIQDIVLEKGTDFSFRSAMFNAELLELAFYGNTAGENDELTKKLLDICNSWLVPAPKSKNPSEIKHCVWADGVQIFGWANEKVDNMYVAVSDAEVKIIYR